MIQSILDILGGVEGGSDMIAEQDIFENGLSERATSAEAKIAEMEAANQALEAAIQAAKAHNYDLLQQIPAKEEPPAAGAEEDEPPVKTDDELYEDVK